MTFTFVSDSDIGEHLTDITPTFSPGSILSRELFRHALDVDRVEEMDYGVGSENYKKDWMSSVRRLEGMQAYNTSTITGLYRSGHRSVQDMVKRIMRK